MLWAHNTKRCTSVEIVFQIDGTQRINYVEAVVKEGQLKTISTGHSFTDISELKSKINKDLPITLTLNGKGILHRLGNILADNDQEILSGILPNTKLSDFYIQSYKSEQGTWVSIIRRKAADDIINMFTGNGYHIVSLGMGPFSVMHCVNQFTMNDSKLEFSGHTLTLENENLMHYEYTAFAHDAKLIKIGSQDIDERLIIAWSVAVGQLVFGENHIETNIESVATLKREFIDKYAFKKLCIFILVLFLTILSVNFYLFQKAFARNNKLLATSQSQEGKEIKATALLKDISIKENFLSQSGWSANLKNSFYADRLASTVPASIKLLQLNITPYDDQESKKAKKFIFKSKLVEVNGYCSDPSALSSWIQNLKAVKWVKHVRVHHYVFDDRSSNANFMIQIEI